MTTTGASIAVIAPAPVPTAFGGAERLWWGLVDHLNRHTEHRAELIKLPTAERNLTEILHGYERWAALDLSAYDAVVAGKYPAWMVEHPNLRVYLLHRLRGLYDTYALSGLPTHVQTADPDVKALDDHLRATEGQRTALDETFARARAIATRPDLPPSLIGLPGSLTRRLVHWLDGVGLDAPGAVQQFSTLSQTVRDRPGSFPAGADVRVAHPMTDLQGLEPTGDGHLLAVSRLDRPKRLDLVIEAMAENPTIKLPLLVVGTGPEHDRLTQLAAPDPRIRLLGHVNDDALVRLYNDARAVVFVPDQEDFGYITLEAMLASKPVLTTTDAGGPTELVRDGVDGFITEPTPQAVGQALARLAQDRRGARRMGREARERVRGIGWHGLADAILAP